MEKEKYNISKGELNALKMSYYIALHTLHHDKGFKYRQAFNIIKKTKELADKIKNENIDDYINVFDDSEVLINENSVH